MQMLLFLGMFLGLTSIFTYLGRIILTNLTGIDLVSLTDPSKLDFSNPATLTALRGMLLLQFVGIWLIPTLLFAYFSDPKPTKYLGLKPPTHTGYWLVGIAIMFLAIPLVEYIGVLNKQLHFGAEMQAQAKKMEEDAARLILFMLSDNSLSNLFFNLIFIAAFAGIGEELFFRGILQRLFIKSTRSPWAGIIIAAFFFSFFHFQFFGFFPRFLLGILLGAIYWYSGSLWPAILAHFAYDAIILVLAYLNPKMVSDANTPMIETPYLWVGALISAAIVGGLLWWMKKNSTNSYEKVYAGDNMNRSENDFTF